MTSRRLVLAAVAACAAGVALYAFVRRADHAFLVSTAGAEWIRAARPFDLVARAPGPETLPFRVIFSNRSAPGSAASLQVQALRAFRVMVNGRVAGEATRQAASWRHPQRYDVSALLVPGTNELRIDVQNDSGHPLLLAWSDELGIATSREWQAPGQDGSWQPVLLARDARSHAISSEFPTAWQGLRATWGFLLLTFAFGAGVSLLASARHPALLRAGWLRPSHVRWLLLGGLALLGLHNLRLVDLDAGFDAKFHFDYIREVAATRRVPLANEGWQFFQAPLFYLLAAPPYLAIARFGSEEAARLAMRLLVLSCALGIVQMVYLAARAAFPTREDLQSIATATGGFLPMTVYMSHYVSNEPLAALLTAALVAASFRLLAGARADLARWSFGLGVLFGLALLAKVTVALLLPLLVAVLVRTAQRSGIVGTRAIGPLLRFGVASSGIAGWYFVRNWVALGTPYIGGWDPTRGGAWVQDPGYRIPQDLLTFGVALARPIYAGFSGLWDALYAGFWLDGFLGSSAFAIAAPPWHYDYVAACALLALPLGAASLAGFARALRVPRTPADEVLLFSAAAVAVYLAAMFVLYLRLPVFSTVKSTYTMGLAPCYGVLFAWGIDLLPRRCALRALLAGYLCAWLAFVFRAYFS